ncbi:tyrosine-type recombinase/integrase [Jiangella alkaliphila]|uniref:Site-specific recombinase XerD n=1 Tax=Jiangella alkaliphila TaxID=419479 RepID=A0A1H2L284_9ACTN|nr:tyrosine-type recombinase/integrase [Jiangella alkaliphila]SDU74904.1 Site-specific recombinase XerD [Jiangella alkaliphila]
MSKVEKRPPVGVELTVDIEEVQLKRGGVSFWARVRWTDPVTSRRDGVKRAHPTIDAANAWVDRMTRAASTGLDPGQTLAEYVATIGARWARQIDKTSTLGVYSAGLRLRVIPTLGHLPVNMITAGLIDRVIDDWEDKGIGGSTIKNTIASLVLVLNEAKRDELIDRNPADDRARRTAVGRRTGDDEEEAPNPRDFALPDVAALDELVAEVAKAGRHQCWGDMVTILATTAMRISEASGLEARYVDLSNGVIKVEWQLYPGEGGLVRKRTKGRRRRAVPIIEPLVPTLERLMAGRKPDDRLLRGPRGGVITTATLRDATRWDELVTRLGHPTLVRHGLRHTALTWMADAGVSLDVLQKVAGHQSPDVTSRYLHPDLAALKAAGESFSSWWSGSGPSRPQLKIIRGGDATSENPR